jgi:hypothetical protein
MRARSGPAQASEIRGLVVRDDMVALGPKVVATMDDSTDEAAGDAEPVPCSTATSESAFGGSVPGGAA